MPLNQYTTFVHELDLIDKEHFNQADSDRLFIAVNAGVKGAMNPAQAFVRYQLMEAFIRIAKSKYHDSGICPDEALALEQLCEINLLPKVGQLNQQVLRKSTFWNQWVDNILKAYKPMFFNIYNKFGGTHRKPSQPMFMTCDELENLVMQAGLVNDTMMQRDISLFFKLSMMT